MEQTLLPLTEATFYILLSLSAGRKHGYAILKDVSALSVATLELSTSTLYGAIKRMMRDGLVQRSVERPDPQLHDERRRYYGITDFGRAVARAEASRIERLAQLAKSARLLTPAP